MGIFHKDVIAPPENLKEDKYIQKVKSLHPEALTTKAFAFLFIYEPEDGLYRLAIAGGGDFRLVLRVSPNHIRGIKDQLIDDFRIYNLD